MSALTMCTRQEGYCGIVESSSESSVQVHTKQHRPVIFLEVVPRSYLSSELGRHSFADLHFTDDKNCIINCIPEHLIASSSDREVNR